MLYTCLLTIGIIMIVSQIENKGAADEKGLKLAPGYFATGPVFNISAIAIMIILTALYAIFW